MHDKHEQSIDVLKEWIREAVLDGRGCDGVFVAGQFTSLPQYVQASLRMYSEGFTDGISTN